MRRGSQRRLGANPWIALVDRRPQAVHLAAARPSHEVLLAVPPSQFIVVLTARSLSDVVKFQEPGQEAMSAASIYLACAR